ncbi:type I restriction endonuclease subunit R [Pseudoxanthomonas beigongshangi]
MSKVGQKEIATQQRLIELFEQLGYEYLGHWKDRGGSNVEEDHLSAWLRRRGYDDRLIGKVLYKLAKEKALGGSCTLYEVNRDIYGRLRYGITVQPEAGEKDITVDLIDWKHPQENDFAIAEEVTVLGEHTKRPDLVLYVNGIALGVLELKRSTVSVSEGIRQNLDSQKKEFIEPFFTTVQLVMAGNDTEGLRYGVIQTREKYYLAWKEEGEVENPLDRAVVQLCRKDRLLELIHDYLAFDAGTKKACRHNQYFGVRKAQDHIRRREGGIIWHTQGSGKSLTMVWLAKWIRENVADSRVLLITDRTELDQQIETVFRGVGEDIYRTKSGDDLVRVLNAREQWLIGSLVHKFGSDEELSDKEVDAYVEGIRNNLPKGFVAKGDIYVFVDECHRTQSGKLHQAMKTLLPGAMFIGFTGTPLLAADKQKSIEIFGPYIHTYKYDEAVRDGVVLDLRYEARDIDQKMSSPDKVDQWFEIKTKGLSDVGKARVKKRWGTMQRVLSARDRLEKIVADILLDMETRPRLLDGRGNAILVTASIYSACRIFEMFQKTDLAEKCAIVTSYRPSPNDIKGEESGEGLTEKLLQYGVYRRMLAEHFNEPEETAMYKAETFEKNVKKRFIEDPGQMRLLIVVDKLLTGFDAPAATYLYIDKQMQDHGLFQAICRVNRLDGDDKDYGYIIDYKDLFKSLEGAIQDYTGEAFAGYDKDDVAGLLKDRLEQGRQRLDEIREAIKALCEPVMPPYDTPAYLHYFCGPSADKDACKDNEPKRVALYKLVGSYLRAYADLANEMAEAGYSAAEAKSIKDEVTHYDKVRDEVSLASGDYVDMKSLEPAMRHLLDTYIRADDSEKVSAFDDMSLIDLIVARGEDAVDALPEGIRKNEDAMAETIENNVRKLIIDEMAVNPKYYEKMSELLDALIKQRKDEAIKYKEYLKQVVELTKKVKTPEGRTNYPPNINSPARQALFDNLSEAECEAVAATGNAIGEGSTREKAVHLFHDAILAVTMADWRGNLFKERRVRGAIAALLGEATDRVDAVFELVKNQREY